MAELMFIPTTYTTTSTYTAYMPGEMIQTTFDPYNTWWEIPNNIGVEYLFGSETGLMTAKPRIFRMQDNDTDDQTADDCKELNEYLDSLGKKTEDEEEK